MTFDSQNRDDFVELLDALLDGSLTVAQHARLSETLSSSEEARRLYLQYMGLSASLLEYAGESQLATPTAGPATNPRRRVRKLVWSLVGGALAAAVLLAVVLHSVSDREAEAEADEFAAQITGLDDCSWTGLQPMLGDQLSHGQRLELKSGIAEITFDSGAQVTLEGPATLDLTSAWEATLHRGKLRAEVPAEAVGFAVQSTTVDVVDLGTEFGMTVDSSGATDVCVLQGEVEATPREPASSKPIKYLIKQEKARRFNRNGSEEIENAASLTKQFVKPAKLKRLVKQPKYTHWSFNEPDRRRFHDEAIWSYPSDDGIALETKASEEPGVPTGRSGYGLRFDGQLTAHAAVPDFANRGAHTIAFWVRVPTDAISSQSGPIIAWLTKAQDPKNVQPIEIGWNMNPAQGPVGALRVDVGRITAVGDANLRDGQWHHVAVIIVPRNSGKQRWHVRQYVDGHLETAPNKIAKRPRPDSVDDPADDVVWLGRDIGSSSAMSGTFRGDLDELYIADRALQPGQIAELAKHNVGL